MYTDDNVYYAAVSLSVYYPENLKECSERYKEALERIEDGNQQENMAFIAELPLLHTGQFYTLIQDYFLKRKSEWIWYFLEAQDRNVTFSQLIHDLEMYDTPEVRIKY